MEAHKKQILERYGYLRHEMAMSYRSPSKQEQLKLEIAKVKFDMEINDLTEADFLNFKKERNEKDLNQRKTHLNKEANNALEKGIVFLVVGIAAIFLGIGLTDAMNGGLVFYGLVLTGILFLMKGGMELNLYRLIK